MINKTICIFHNDCDDGFTAAFLVRSRYVEEKSLENLEFFGGVHQTAPPNVKDKHVIMVDFSYKRSVMEKLVAESKSFFWMDHHISAIKDMEDFKWRPQDTKVLTTEKCGSKIVYDTLMINKKYQEFVDYIDDRDRFVLKKPGIEQFTLAVRSYEQTFENWEVISTNVKALVESGAHLLRYYKNGVAEILRTQRERVIRGYTVPTVNAPRMYASDVSEVLMAKAAFSATYYFDGKAWYFSLRSAEDSIDVSEIAKTFGGGGHAHAAGFAVESLGEVFGSKPVEHEKKKINV